MKTIFTTILILISTSVIADYLIKIPANISNTDNIIFLPIVEVYDGDTIKTHMHWYLPEPLDKVSIRIRGVDTPEMPAKSYLKTGKLGRAKCVKEAELALEAKAAVQQLLHVPKYDYMMITNYEWGKYGGRIVGDVEIHGTDVREMLLNDGYAVEYDGGKKTHDWCAK